MRKYVQSLHSYVAPWQAPATAVLPAPLLHGHFYAPCLITTCKVCSSMQTHILRHTAVLPHCLHCSVMQLDAFRTWVQDACTHLHNRAMPTAQSSRRC